MKLLGNEGLANDDGCRGGRVVEERPFRVLRGMRIDQATVCRRARQVRIVTQWRFILLLNSRVTSYCPRSCAHMHSHLSFTHGSMQWQRVLLG